MALGKTELRHGSKTVEESIGLRWEALRNVKDNFSLLVEVLMSVNLPNWYARQYSTNIQLKLQAMGSLLRPVCDRRPLRRRSGIPVDFMGSVEMQDVTQRFAPMGRVDAATDRRWVFPVDSDLPQMIDKFDKLRLLTDPESKMVENGVSPRAVGWIGTSSTPFCGCEDGRIRGFDDNFHGRERG